MKKAIQRSAVPVTRPGLKSCLTGEPSALRTPVKVVLLRSASGAILCSAAAICSGGAFLSTMKRTDSGRTVQRTGVSRIGRMPPRITRSAAVSTEQTANTGHLSPRSSPDGYGADEDAVLGMRLGSRHGATRAHRPGLSPVPLPDLWQAIQ